MKKWLKLLASTIGIIIALCLTKFINLFDYVTFIPQDKKFDVCLTVYFAVIGSLVNVLWEHAENWIEKKRTSIEVVFHLPTEIENMSSVPKVTFNESDVAEVCMHVRIKGNTANILEYSLIIRYLRQADMQPGKKGVGSVIDYEGNYVLRINEICQNLETISYEADYPILFQRSEFENRMEINVCPEIQSEKKKQNVFINFKTNNMILILEEKI